MLEKGRIFRSRAQADLSIVHDGDTSKLAVVVLPPHKGLQEVLVDEEKSDESRVEELGWVE